MSRLAGIAIERRHKRAFGTFVILSAVFVALLVLGEFVSNSNRSLIWLMSVNIIAVLGFQLYSGNSGKMSLAHPAFMGLGAYVAALFTIPPMIAKSVQRDAPKWLQAMELDPAAALVIGVMATVVVASFIGLVIVRLNFDGVVITTWSILIISQTLIFSMRGWTNGGTSLYGLPLFNGPMLLGICGVITIAVCVFFKESRAGLQLRAARDDDLASLSMGVANKRVNLLAWVLSAAIAATAGVLLTHVLGAAGPRNFFLVLSVELFAMLVLGGQRSVSGSFVGALLVSGIVLYVRKIEGGVDLGFIELPAMFGITQMVLAGAILLILYLRPQGLFNLFELRLPGMAGKAPAPEPLEKIELHTGGGLEISDLSKHFGGLEALDGISGDIQPGQIIGLIGPNGAGKSTLINTVMGGYYATRGSISINGHDATTWSAYKLAREGIGRTFQQIKLFGSLTVVENVMVPQSVVTSRGVDLEAEALGWLKRLGVDHLANRFPDELSYGDRRRVEIARALALHPTYLLLDEPAAGMNHDETDELRQLLMDIRDQYGVGILIVEHDLPLIMTMCDHIMVINRGRMIAEGTPEEVQANPEVIDAYIGSDHVEKGATA